MDRLTMAGHTYIERFRSSMFVVHCLGLTICRRRQRSEFPQGNGAEGRESLRILYHTTRGVLEDMLVRGHKG